MGAPLVRQADAAKMKRKLLELDATDRVLNDLFLLPRAKIHEWARLTNQTAQAKTGYVGQHLASVLTGVPGTGSAARGEDLADKTEVKTCSRADQLGTCITKDAKGKICGNPVPSWRTACGLCKGKDIKRKADSHWIIRVTSKAEVDALVNRKRVLFILLDRPAETPADIRVRAWEVWPGHPEHKHFGLFVRDYYENNYLVKTPRAAPANLHPLSFNFLLMNPLLIFEATLRDADGEDPEVEPKLFVRPKTIRKTDLSPELPPSLCKPAEIYSLLQRRKGRQILTTALRDGKTLKDVKDAVLTKKGVTRTGRDKQYRESIDAALKTIPPLARPLIAAREKHVKTDDLDPA